MGEISKLSFSFTDRMDIYICAKSLITRVRVGMIRKKSDSIKGNEISLSAVKGHR